MDVTVNCTILDLRTMPLSQKEYVTTGPMAKLPGRQSDHLDLLLTNIIQVIKTVLVAPCKKFQNYHDNAVMMELYYMSSRVGEARQKGDRARTGRRARRRTI